MTAPYAWVAPAINRWRWLMRIEITFGTAFVIFGVAIYRINQWCALVLAICAVVEFVLAGFARHFRHDLVHIRDRELGHT